jgi:succinoglycan biosynthesis transport protein ExoP
MKELLNDLRGRFEWVILDSPPIIPFADARVLSTLVDGVVLVARYGHTSLKAMILSTEILRDFEAPVIGAVLNGMDRSSPDYTPYLLS